MRLALVLSVVGRLMKPFGLAFLLPLILAVVDGNTQSAIDFATCALGTFLTGTILGQLAAGKPDLRRVEALGVVAFTWVCLATASAMPYFMAGLDPIDSFFESMSGFTTTGATILVKWDFDRAFFLWRSMTQWFGGVGVIALFVVVLPHLGVGGRQLFFAEASSAPSESVAPKIRDTAMRLWIIYIFLTVLETALLHLWSGMPLYDSLCHAFTTMPAGGFSPNPASIAGYATPGAFPNYNPIIGEWIITGFMIIAGMSFPLLWVALSRKPSVIARDSEFRFYFFAILSGSAVVTFLIGGLLPQHLEIRQAAFQTASLISSTGYASTDYNLWNDSARIILIIVMLIGGCAGSAAGGAKAVRNLISLKFLYRELTRVLHPRAVMPLRHKSQPIPERIVRAVLTVAALYLIGYICIGAVMVLLGANFQEGFTAALACLGNIGPGYGKIGPMGSFADFNAVQKIILSLAMWCGRLEIVSVLAILHPDVISRLRWRGSSRNI